MTTRDFIGRGIDLPFGIDAIGRIATVGGAEAIERSIRMILSTVPGERPMRPEFGCGIHRYLFEPIDSATAGRLVDAIAAALARWEPRITVEEIGLSFEQDDGSTLYIDIRYTVRSDNSRRNLVFPYYVIGPEG